MYVAEKKMSLNVIHGNHLSYLIFENKNHHQHHQKGISWRFIASDTQTGCCITTYQEMAKRKTSEALHFSFSVAKLSSRSTYRHAFERLWKLLPPKSYEMKIVQWLEIIWNPGPSKFQKTTLSAPSDFSRSFLFYLRPGQTCLITLKINFLIGHVL